jgi:hypothetical protein
MSGRFSAHVEDIPPHGRFLFKPIPNATSDGCHMDIWLPEAKETKVPLVM